MLLWVAIILLILLISMTSYEHMTNQDVLDVLKTFGVGNETSGTTRSQAPIYGPKVSSIVEPEPEPEYNNEEVDSLRKYPDIYGPDVRPMISNGRLSLADKSSCNGKNESDAPSGDDGSYDYNIDLKKAFPTDGPPEPFLGDFSSFHN